MSDILMLDPNVLATIVYVTSKFKPALNTLCDKTLDKLSSEARKALESIPEQLASWLQQKVQDTPTGREIALGERLSQDEIQKELVLLFQKNSQLYDEIRRKIEGVDLRLADVENHILKEYPLGPCVPSNRIPTIFSKAYARILYQPLEASLLISDMSQMIIEAYPDIPPEKIIITLPELPSLSNAPQMNVFWNAVFNLSGVRSPVTLACLLILGPFMQLKEAEKLERQNFLEFLKTWEG